MNQLWKVGLLCGCAISMGAGYRSPNFQVEAPTAGIARTIAERAEDLRKELAIAWLGGELGTWGARCEVRVTIVLGYNANGATNITYERGRVVGLRMNIEGSVQRILDGVLPHELTHVMFAHFFGQPPPRWADEGGAIASEPRAEWVHRGMSSGEYLDKPEQRIALTRLFATREYPADCRDFYAHSASVAAFLIELGDRQKFLLFVAQGMRDGWDRALNNHYQYRSVAELESAWLRNQHLAHANFQAGRERAKMAAGACVKGIVELLAISRVPLANLTISARNLSTAWANVDLGPRDQPNVRVAKNTGASE